MQREQNGQRGLQVSRGAWRRDGIEIGHDPRSSKSNYSSHLLDQYIEIHICSKRYVGTNPCQNPPQAISRLLRGFEFDLSDLPTKLNSSLSNNARFGSTRRIRTKID
ncbi:hypothetical protein HZ326_5844 [Fusarium oxysporum f. sp. albedinis]|nr:hypothetical protein HZ326_5844 [Fusarium oxysporum f. sp. albedinis]